MSQDRREPLSDQQRDQGVRPQSVAIEARVELTAEKLASGLTGGEKRMWLAGLRSNQPMSVEDQAELADILERQWFPSLNGGRPGKDTWTAYYRTNRGLQRWGADSAIRERQSRGMTRDEAEEEVAAFYGIERRALRRMLSGK